MRFTLALAATLLCASACEPGPTPIDEAAATARKVCGRLYNSSEKVYQDELYKRGVPEVKFAAKDAFIEKCTAMSMTKDDLRCADPNLAGEAACKEVPAELAAKHKELKEFMIEPTVALLKAKAGGGAEGAAAGGEAAPDGAAPADGAEAPPGGDAPAPGGDEAPADGSAQ